MSQWILLLIIVVTLPGNSWVKNDVRASKSWVFFRDANVVKQSTDYSCGAASLATILTYHFNQPTTEAEILLAMELDGKSSLMDLKLVAQSFGFRALGIQGNMDAVKALKIPVIVHLNYKGQDHFSVVHATSNEYIHLADSSWGNRKLRDHRFEQLFYTNQDGEKQSGHMLLILPKKII